MTRTRPFAWRVLLPGILFAGALGVIGGRMRPPAPGIEERCLTIVSVLLAAKLFAWVAEKGHAFGREERLATFVSFIAIGMCWVGLRQSIAEAAFDYVVVAQRADLAQTSRTLAYQMDAFLQGRRRVAPTPPRPATWQEDEDAFGRFETETVRLYERQFGPRVRASHDLMSLRGLGDREFDRFYRRPANEFQMRVVAERLAFFAGKLDEQNSLAR
jgi:hypothetical protein